MCDYSLELRESRPAKIGERLISTRFPRTITRGFAPKGDDERGVAVCLLPGTELAFAAEVQVYRPLLHIRRSTGHKLARFRQVNQGQPDMHHDALEFPDGEICLLTNLCEGQDATVLQLPVSGEVASADEVNSEGAPAVS